MVIGVGDRRNQAFFSLTCSLPPDSIIFSGFSVTPKRCCLLFIIFSGICLNQRGSSSFGVSRHHLLRLLSPTKARSSVTPLDCLCSTPLNTQIKQGHSHIAVVCKDLNESRARLKSIETANNNNVKKVTVLQQILLDLLQDASFYELNVPLEKILGLANLFLGVGVPGNAHDFFDQINSLVWLENNKCRVRIYKLHGAQIDTKLIVVLGRPKFIFDTGAYPKQVDWIGQNHQIDAGETFFMQLKLLVDLHSRNFRSTE